MSSFLCVHAMGLLKVEMLIAGKTLPPFPGDNSSETTGDGSSPTASEPVPTMMAAVRAEADRIIAATASSGAEGGKAEATTASVTP